MEEPGTWFQKLWKGALELADRYPRGVNFVVATPPYVTLREQTTTRLTAAQLKQTGVMMAYGRKGGQDEVSQSVWCF